MIDLPHTDGKLKSEEWIKSVHPDDVSILNNFIKEVFESGKSTGIIEYRIRKKDGSYFWAISRGKIVSTSPDGKPARVIGINADITPLKKAREDIEKKNLDLLEKINDLEKMQKVLIERENKMVELKTRLSKYEPNI